jgi:hypothetical protein
LERVVFFRVWFKTLFSQSGRQSFRQRPWHLNSLEGPPRGPPQLGQMRFKIEETSYSVSRVFRDVTACIAPPDLIVHQQLFAISSPPSVLCYVVETYQRYGSSAAADAAIWSLRLNRSSDFGTCHLRSSAADLRLNPRILMLCPVAFLALRAALD